MTLETIAWQKEGFLTYISASPVNIWYDHMVYQYDGLGYIWLMG